MAAGADAVRTAGDRAVGGAVAAVLRVGLEVVGEKTGAMTAALDELAEYWGRREVTYVFANTAVVGIVGGQGAGKHPIGRATDMKWRAFELRAAASTVLHQQNALSLATSVERITDHTTGSTVIGVELQIGPAAGTKG